MDADAKNIQTENAIIGKSTQHHVVTISISSGQVEVKSQRL